MNNDIKFLDIEWRTPYPLTNFEDRFGLHDSAIILDSNMRGFLFICTLANSHTLVVNWQNCSYYSTGVDLYSHQILFEQQMLNLAQYLTLIGWIYFRKCSKYQVWKVVSLDWQIKKLNYGNVIMGAIASQITTLMIVYSTVYSGADQRKHQSSASLAFMRGIHRVPVNSPHKWQGPTSISNRDFRKCQDIFIFAIISPKLKWRKRQKYIKSFTEDKNLFILQSMTWLLMSWWRTEPWHQQAWYLLCYHWIYCLRVGTRKINFLWPSTVVG